MRSLLFAPASHPRHSEKVFGCGADAAILDLEDAVAIADKPAARGRAAAALAVRRRGRTFVRINALETEFAFGDLLEVVRPGLDGIILPKAQSAEDVALADWLVGQLEREHGLAPGAVELLPIVETARGVMNAATIAARSRRVRRLAFGAGDYVNDVGAEWTDGEEALALARLQVAAAARAAGLAPPIDTAHTNIADAGSLERAARRARTYGFGGKFCIHPSQVAAVNRAFTPGEAEVARARRIVAAFGEAERRGLAAIRVDGALVDYPIALRAARMVRAVDEVRDGTAA
ncbi:Citrate lyase subunit beta [Methylobacterium crusticola]|uniref:Citrate lyase subunit beta n=1 Tax=Methylobacterium crusticola TaxID=1697972 RepID=A0ABQ4QSM8_9HYPH|nr:CoA ester lyase [Methylobacterium crusticola]GJD48318.1 Citrate lyase subunit beta [Methylobacterium crusticola]